MSHNCLLGQNKSINYPPFGSKTEIIITSVKKRNLNYLRPTKSIVKNAIFNILGDISGLKFLDLFAGTGQIGIEAEKRGAKVIFVEKNKNLAREIRKKTKEGKVITGDAFKFLEKNKEKFHVIFADPPYILSEKEYEKLIKLALYNLEEGGVFILEHEKKKHFNAPEERQYGDTLLSIWTKE